MQAKSSTVPAEPYPFELRPAECALLIIDMQRDFLEPGGFGEMLGNDVSQLRRTIEPNRRLLAAWRAAGLLVDAHPRGPSARPHRPAAGQEGARPQRDLRSATRARWAASWSAARPATTSFPSSIPLPGEPVIDKPGKGAFYATDLHAILQNRGITQLVVTGVTTEVCVNTTVREANDRGYDCLVPEDCVGSYFPEFQEMGLKMIKAQGGIFGWVGQLGRHRRGDRRRLSAAPQSAVSQEERHDCHDHDFKPKLWVPGDWNAFFGFGTNILVNLLVLTGLLRFVLKMPDELVFGRILPATGLMLCLSTLYYAWLAYRWRKETGRTDVCALPSGISVPHMFVVVFVIMLPILIATKDPMQAWEAGLTWVFIQSFVLMVGGFIAPDHPQDHAARGAARLAGRRLDHLHLDAPGRADVHDAGDRRGLLRDHPGRLVRRRALLQGRAGRPGGDRRRRRHRLGLDPLRLQLRRHDARRASRPRVSSFGFSYPMPAVGHVFGGFQFLGVILVTAIPFGIYDLVEAMDNVESAAAAGDSFPTTRVLTADGVVSLIGCLMGNPFINAVYIGHPGWKAMGGRIGYSAATGVAGDRAVLVRRHRADDGADPGRRDPADPALHRHADRLAGVPGNAEAPCAGDRAGAGAADRGLGQDCRSTTRSAPPAPTPRRSASTSSARPACSTTAWRSWAAARSWPASSWARSRCSSSSATSSRRRPSPSPARCSPSSA